MSIILLADDSPHAQRMGERILREEGFAVVSVTDGETALLRMQDVDPDLVIADVFLPGRNGFDLCRNIKNTHRHVRVILTAGLLETFDEDEARRAGCDAILKKPFEASVVIDHPPADSRRATGSRVVRRSDGGRAPVARGGRGGQTRARRLGRSADRSGTGACGDHAGARRGAPRAGARDHRTRTGRAGALSVFLLSRDCKGAVLERPV